MWSIDDHFLAQGPKESNQADMNEETRNVIGGSHGGETVVKMGDKQKVEG